MWFVGLPGSGKSSLARGVAKALRAEGMDVDLLEMDARRKSYFPNPTYSGEERAEAYRLFAEEGAALARDGRRVVMDGTAPKRAMRDHCRNLAPRFVEVMVRCRLETAMAREAARPEGLVMAGLYEKALERRRTGQNFPGLGQVVGVDVPFEENPEAELVIENDCPDPERGVAAVLEFLRRWLGDFRR
ncbi:MAG: adenylyl-sulfate kinase [Deltaproteobacteria bacterium]|nr:adenylyl-sulfate kinase [Deltaproteobacteria bacterium]